MDLRELFVPRMFSVIFLILWSLLLMSHCSAQKPNLEGMLNRRQDVYIAGFFPFGKGVDQSSLGRGVMPSVKLALDHVNEHSGVLRNYRLHMWWNDTECNAAVGVKSFFDMMHSGPHKLMLFGAACTHVTDPIAKASKHWHLTQLSYADTHPMFTKDSFPNFFRIVPSENAFNLPRLALLRQFNWTRVGTIYQNEPRYSLAHNRLVADLDLHGFQVVETQSFATEVRTALEKLKEKDVRIILGNFNESWAVQIFCEAFKLGIYGRAYQWLIMGTYSDQWWTKHEEMRESCNETDVAESLESAILTDLLPLSTTGDITISGITASEYKVEYDSRRGNEYSRFHGYTYDGIWAVALAIQNVAQRVRVIKRNKTVVDFKYRDPLWEKLFLEALRNISFEGVTGPVRFYDNERKASILLKQFQVEGEVKVGEYCSELDRLDFSMGQPMRWIGRYPPKDRTLHIIEHSQVNTTIYAILACCSVVGILLALLFLIVNITYRNQRYIKMSSPYLNNLIIIGCMLTYMSVIFLGLDSGLSSVAAFPYICTARAWLLMAGFSLAFGAMFSKTWRVHSIFTDVKLNKKVIKDYQLFMVVGVLLAIDIAIMTTWQISDPFYRETKQMDPYPHSSSEDILIIRENEYCQSERMPIFLGVIYAYKGLLMIFGAFLAWETRNVSIPALNDSKHVGLSVYNVVIMCIMGAPIALVLADRKDAVFVLISVFIIFCTTATLCLVFVPKLVELRRNKKGGGPDKKIRATLRTVGGGGRSTLGHSSGGSSGGGHSPPPGELERRLKEQRATNSRYKKTLQAKESELQMLMGKLGEVPTPVAGKGAAQPKVNVGNLLAPKENASQMDTSEITSLCSLSASQGGEDFYYMQQLERSKEISVVSASQSSQGTDLPTEVPPPKKESTKNVSFKNHTDSSPTYTRPSSLPPESQSNRESTVRDAPILKDTSAPRDVPIVREQMQGRTGTTPTGREHIPNNAFRGHAEVLSSNGSRPVMEKDQLAKSPYGWRQEIVPEPQQKQVTVQPPQYVKQSPQQEMPPEREPQGGSARGHRRAPSETVPAETVRQLRRESLVGREEERLMDEDMDELPDSKRLSQRRDSEKRRSNFVVAQSDLWDTNTFAYACAVKPPSHHHTPMQRSVSERSQRHHSHGQLPTPPHSQSRELPSHQSSGNVSQRTTPERKPSNASLRSSGAGSHYGSGHELNHIISYSSSIDTSAPLQHNGDDIQLIQQQQAIQQQMGIVSREPSQGALLESSPGVMSTATLDRSYKRRESGGAQLQHQQDIDTISKKQQQDQLRHKQQLQLFQQPSRVSSTSHRAATPGTQPSRKSITHHLSTPDVHGRKSKSERSRSNVPGNALQLRRMHAASSESELFECAILPIFQKLLSERHRSQPHGLDLPYGLSCPNISIKCDIVEYL